MTDKVNRTVIEIADINRHGEAINIPESMTFRQAIEILQAWMVYEEQDVAINVRFDAFLLDGALALQKALAEKFGWVNMVPTPGFWSDDPPAMISVATSPTDSVQVPWGRLRVPGINGFLNTGSTKTNDGRLVFVLGGIVKRKHERQVNEIVALTKLYLREQSIYKGKAIRLRFTDDDDDALEMPEPKFMDLSHVHEDELIFSASVHRAIHASLFTPITEAKRCRELGIPLKRGVLLAGDFGVGKTLAANVAAHKAQQSGWTFVYCERASELADIVRFAQQYTPAVVFCEDIDRVVSGERNVDMDDILAIVDGIDSKDTELMVVLTTNNVDEINQAMLRPGRLDAIINVTPPDAEAVVKLIKLYARGLLAEGEDFSEVGRKLEGKIPAVIRECVERSKLHALRLAAGDGGIHDHIVITAEALIGAADEMTFALDLLAPKSKDETHPNVKAAEILADAISASNGNGHGQRVVQAASTPR